MGTTWAVPASLGATSPPRGPSTNPSSAQATAPRGFRARPPTCRCAHAVASCGLCEQVPLLTQHDVFQRLALVFQMWLLGRWFPEASAQIVPGNAHKQQDKVGSFQVESWVAAQEAHALAMGFGKHNAIRFPACLVFRGALLFFYFCSNS